MSRTNTDDFGDFLLGMIVVVIPLLYVIISPIVDMERLITDMMTWANTTSIILLYLPTFMSMTSISL